ncbi:hypothetical protein GCM10025862_15790 [Arsenicicoccus piscis]|uniref:ABC transporter domain-containing protein n=1 Tax=Arsenicicoccus piscis TaxID=673954 RepID=A0ABQ6HM78_9MICO|nr:hypothetical protein GCM10025862_15790 [Arsenicicoccus piscis]
MIAATGIELRAGARVLIEDATFRVAKGDRVGLVGRNGAGKTTLTKVLAGEGQPASGQVTRSGTVGYLPQDPRTGDLDVLARDRILSARGLDVIVTKLRETEGAMASADAETHERAMERYPKLLARFEAAGVMPRRPRPPRSPRPSASRRARWGSRCAPSRVASVAASSSPESCSATPRRCCSTSRRTTWTPTRSCGCATTSRSTRVG